MIMENALAGKFFKPCFHLNSRKSLVLQKKKGIGSSHKFCYPSKFKIHPLLSHTLCLSNLEVGGVETQETSYEGLVSDHQIVWPSPDDEIPFWKRDFPSWNVNPDVPNESSVKDSDLMHIIHVTAEMAPIAKVGGLGDVVTGLARASLSRGHTVDIVLPFYECIQKQQINDLALITTYDSYHDGNWIPTNAYRGVVSGIPVIFIEPSNEFFKGQQVYGGSYNELEAYLFFSRACLEWMQVTDTQPDIIHVHEWQIGALPLLYWDMYRYLSLKKPRIVLTIHNMEHYGECRQEQLSKCGLDGSMYATAEKAVDDRTIGHNPERLSLLKGGIVYSNAVVTVSPTYLKETLCSGWLASTLMMHCDKYFGVLNGIDTAMWNPATDVFLPAKFHAQKIEGKKLCKYYIQRGLGLAAKSITSSNHVPDATVKIPLVVCITRLVPQKGLHLITHALKHVEELGGQMIVLGKAPDGRVEGEFKHLADLHNQGRSIRILLMYSEELSHMLYAAADMVLVPSMYEPCGLSQIIGMRYGSGYTDEHCCKRRAATEAETSKGNHATLHVDGRKEINFPFTTKECKQILNMLENKSSSAYPVSNCSPRKELSGKAFSLGSNGKSSIWILDDGCMDHMIWDHRLFTFLNTVNNRAVELPNGSQAQVII